MHSFIAKPTSEKSFWRLVLAGCKASTYSCHETFLVDQLQLLARISIERQRSTANVRSADFVVFPVGTFCALDIRSARQRLFCRQRRDLPTATRVHGYIHLSQHFSINDDAGILNLLASCRSWISSNVFQSLCQPLKS
jgi:hypothetical protein